VIGSEGTCNCSTIPQPYTSSAEDTPVSSLGAGHMPTSTQGRCSAQSAPQLRDLKAAYNCLWHVPPSRCFEGGRQLS
jgi:hypothetical protein